MPTPAAVRPSSQRHSEMWSEQAGLEPRKRNADEEGVQIDSTIEFARGRVILHGCWRAVGAG